MPSRAVTGLLALTLALAAGPASRAATGTPPAAAPPGAPAPAKPGPVTAKPAPAPAKSAPAAVKPMPGDEWIAALENSLQRSAAALHHYEWTESTVVTVKGEEMSRKESRCRYGPEGRLQRDDVAAAPDTAGKNARGGHGRGITTSVESLPDSIKEAAGLVNLYLPLQAARIKAAREAGRVTVKSPDAQGKAHIVIADYLKAGDSVAVDLDTGTSRVAALAISTFTDKVKHAGTLNVNMASLPDGTAYPSNALLEIKDEGISIAVKNGGHKKTRLPD